MTNYRTGHEAEKVAAAFLVKQGFKVIELNWRTRLCEIDIVAQNNNVIYFVEVKYRHNNQQGSGLDYITSAKLKQMQFAAECWVQEHNYEGDYELSALEVSADFEITQFLPQLG